MTDATYTDRQAEGITIESIEGGTIRRTDGWCFGAPTQEITDQLEAGRDYIIETRGFSWILGLQNPRTGEWYWRKSDQDLDREHREFVERMDREHEERWAANKDDWAAREARLSLPLRRRLERFRANGGHKFEVDGWGYELVVCELAVLYAASGGEDDEAISAFAREHGTSGNQHDYAKALSRYLVSGELDDEDVVANSVSALTPLTGDADYSGSKATA